LNIITKTGGIYNMGAYLIEMDKTEWLDYIKKGIVIRDIIKENDDTFVGKVSDEDFIDSMTVRVKI